jgi:hypothetical protein
VIFLKLKYLKIILLKNMTMTESGYIYVMGNDCMPGIFKVGFTLRTPEERLKEANKHDTFRPPLPYKICLSKKVKNAKEKEHALHKIISNYHERINPKQEFFRISLNELTLFFGLIDSETSTNTVNTVNLVETSSDLRENNNNNEDTDEKLLSVRNETPIIELKQKRKHKKCSKDLIEGQKIRHIIKPNKIWIGTYNKKIDTIEYMGKMFKGRSPIREFVRAHYLSELGIEKKIKSPWNECDYFIDDKWQSDYKSK